MTSNAVLEDAIKTAILAAAHAQAHERLSAAVDAFGRLGALSSGRWRSAVRDLERLEEQLDRALDQVEQDVAERAERLALDEEQLWTLGEAAAAFDSLLEDALDEVEEDSAAEQLLESDRLFGITFVEDQETPNRGVTLLFAWSDPLTPIGWPWEANWVSVAQPDDDDQLDSGAAEGEGQEEGDEVQAGEELDVYEMGELRVSEPVLTDLQGALNLSPDEARQAVAGAAEAFTRASLLAAYGALDEVLAEEHATGPNGHA